MGQFAYKAVDRGGVHISGHIEAADRKSAVAALAQKGHFVLEMAEKLHGRVADGEKTMLDLSRFLDFGRGRIRHKEILAMTTQLSTALRAGLPLLNALSLIRDQQDGRAMKEMLDSLVDSVNTGKSLSEAMTEYEHVFGPLYLSMVEVGETGGILEQTTSQLAGILGREVKVRTNLMNASMYPLFVLVLGIASVTVILTWIMPMVLGSMEGSMGLLPWPTRLLMATSGFLRSLFTSVMGWLVIAAVVVGLVYLWRWTRRDGQLSWDTFKLRIPIMGSVLRTIAVGRFARTLGSLTKGGVTILEALKVVRGTLGNELLGRAIDEVAEKVKRGESVAEPLGESGYFPPLLVQIVSIGEETGKLDEMLLNAAETFDGEADAAVTRFMAIFPALMILALALVIGFIIVATLLPILMMSTGGGML
ncbi:MAG TPA: type II secretion system F family protein [Phycisphaerales bacterium]|nr:type II secretion system F family protein [Phycisphaerales bacterium]